MKYFNRSISLLLLSLLLSGAKDGLMAHGTICSVDRTAVMVEATYHDGSPMSFCDVSVKKTDSDIVSESGSTDRQGRYFLLPPSEGSVTVIVDDGMGHLASVIVDAPTDAVEETTPDGPKDIWLVITGLGAIMGVSGIYLMFRSRRG